MDVNHVIEVAGIVPPSMIEQIWKACQCNNFQRIQDVATIVIQQGYSVDQVFYQISPLVTASADINDLQKAKISIRLAEADKKLVDGADEYLQLMDILSVISTVMQEP